MNQLDQNRQTLIPLIDTPFANLNLSPIDLMDQVEADNLSPYHAVRVGWANHFLTRDERKVRNLASVSFSKIYTTSKTINQVKTKSFLQTYWLILPTGSI